MFSYHDGRSWVQSSAVVNFRYQYFSEIAETALHACVSYALASVVFLVEDSSVHDSLLSYWTDTAITANS